MKNFRYLLLAAMASLLPLLGGVIAAGNAIKWIEHSLTPTKTVSAELVTAELLKYVYIFGFWSAVAFIFVATVMFFAYLHLTSLLYRIEEQLNRKDG